VRRLGRLALPVLLIGVIVACAVAAVRLDQDAAETPSGGDVTGPVTPVLSARRVPDLVSRGGADARLRQGLDALTGALPATSCLVVEADGRTILTHQADLSVIPASTEKVLTAEAALDLIGPDTRFRTSVEAPAPPANGVVTGDLYLVGGGDPVLTTDSYAETAIKQDRAHTRLEELARAVADAGVTRVEGSVLGDESRYTSTRYVDAWPGRFIEQNQTGPLSALSVNDGFESFPTAGDPGAPLRAAPDPATRAAAVFTVLLEQRGVEVVGEPGTGQAPADATEIAHKDSRKLKRIVDQMLTFSDNQTAELLLREIGFVADGSGTTDAGAAAVEAHVRDEGLPADGEDAVDGSGLAAANRLTCGLLVDTLDAAGRQSDLVEGLAVAGEPGTLESFAGTPLEGRLRGKTGSLNDVNALTGVVDLEGGGDHLTFAWIVNNAPFVTEEQAATRGQLGALLASYPDRPPLEDLVPRPLPGQGGGNDGQEGDTG
jgi:D-alanyl-D-alanine carboxypeptidase/D-alanyl-D-alanine-endopeptidase (penicillin-binding protein 4)